MKKKLIYLLLSILPVLITFLLIISKHYDGNALITAEIILNIIIFLSSIAIVKITEIFSKITLEEKIKEADINSKLGIPIALVMLIIITLDIIKIHRQLPTYSYETIGWVLLLIFLEVLLIIAVGAFIEAIIIKTKNKEPKEKEPAIVVIIRILCIIGTILFILFWVIMFLCAGIPNTIFDTESTKIILSKLIIGTLIASFGFFFIAAIIYWIAIIINKIKNTTYY